VRVCVRACPLLPNVNCAAIGTDPKAPIKARSPPKATKAAMNPEDEHRGSYLAYGNRNIFTGAAL
jgi:hypothetical protein